MEAQTNWDELKNRIGWRLVQLSFGKRPKNWRDKNWLRGYEKALESIEKTMERMERKKRVSK